MKLVLYDIVELQYINLRAWAQVLRIYESTMKVDLAAVMNFLIKQGKLFDSEGNEYVLRKVSDL